MKPPRELALALAVYAVLDLSAAGLLRSTPLWGPEAIERRYRVSHPLYHHDLAPGTDLVATWGGIRYPLRTNSLGFRDATARVVPLHGGTPRLLLIGDSFTEGLGVPFEETYAGVLGRRLAGCGIEVLNAGVMSYSPSIYYRKLAYWLDEAGLRADFVLVALDLSDIGDEAGAYRLDADGRVVDRPAPTGLRVRSMLKERSLLFHVLDLARDGLRGRVADPAHFADWTTDPAQFRAYGAEGLRIAAERMDQLVALLRDRGAGIALTVYPYPAEVSARGGAKQEEFWREWAAARSVPFFDLFPAFGGTSMPPEEAVRTDFLTHDVHWSAAGHRLVAETLIGEGLLDTLTARAALRPLDPARCR